MHKRLDDTDRPPNSPDFERPVRNDVHVPKRLRYADRLKIAADRDYADRVNDVHLLIGGTGAVGGATLMKMTRVYDDLRTVRGAATIDGPMIVATGHDAAELVRFRDYIQDATISESNTGTWFNDHIVRLPSGLIIVLHEYKFQLLPRLSNAIESNDLQAYVSTQLSLLEAVLAEVNGSRPFTHLLDSVWSLDALVGRKSKFRSVQIGIPLPSLLAYHLDNLQRLQEEGQLSTEDAENVAGSLMQNLVDDLTEVRSQSDHVLVAHTTAVGGMYDIHGDGRLPTIRLGFAHAAQDSQLEVKRKRAAELSERYAAAGIWNLVTAAAIGIDHVAIDEALGLQKEMRKGLKAAETEPFPGARQATAVHVHPSAMVSVSVSRTSDAPLSFEGPNAANEFRPRFALRSGENGFLSVANAEALYRVMRVASPSELGSVMALVGALGDDPCHAWFPKEKNHVCYYTETDNSRLVFDFLSQPQLRAMQLSGLEPQAFVDLGSSKHQGELHTLGLLILLHRLRTLDLDAIPGAVRSERFDVDTFFEQNSRPLTFEDVQQWKKDELDKLAKDLRVLVSAEKPDALCSLNDFRATNRATISRHRVDVRNAIFNRVLKVVWAITSLGSPVIVAAEDGRPEVRVGWWVAPLSLVVRTQGTLAAWFEKRCAELGKKGYVWSPEQLAQHHFAVNGFIDLRRHAIVASSKTDNAPPSSVVVAGDEDALKAVLARVTPNAFFATCGLVAVLYRLKCLGDYVQAAQSQIKLGTHHDVAWAIPRDDREHTLVVPGVVEALRMVSEGLEKSTGTEILSGNWGYQWFG